MTVQIFSDNRTAVAYLNKQGGYGVKIPVLSGTGSLGLLHSERYHSIATHLPGSQNTLADAVSRGALSLHKLRMDPVSLQPVFEHWGVSDIDVFATTKNKHCNFFCSRGNRPGVSRRWPSPRLDGKVPIHVPSASNPAVGPQKVLMRAPSVHPSDPMVALACVVSDSPPPVLSQIPICAGGSASICSTVLPRPPETHSLAPGLTLSEMVQNVILNARKPSTRWSYQRKWQRSYLSARSSQHSLHTVLNFLVHLKDTGLGLPSLRVYLSAISAYHELIDGKTVFSQKGVQLFPLPFHFQDFHSLAPLPALPNTARPPLAACTPKTITNNQVIVLFI